MITLESIFSKRNIANALEHMAIKKNGVATDKGSTCELEEYWELNHERIIEEINNLSFKPNMVTEYEIINGRGKRRIVTQYTPQDKFITRLIAQKLNQYFTPLFSECSYAYQENKGTLVAVQKAQFYIENHNEFVTEIDIQNYFDEIPIDSLLEKISSHIIDKRVTHLIETYLYCTISRDGEIYRKSKGIVQGCSMSPCFSNLCLDDFDKLLDDRGYNWIRFADNICVYSISEEEGIRIYNELIDILNNEYKLP